jgi:predicted aldo/keto reductase-like oxidoreductase
MDVTRRDFLGAAALSAAAGPLQGAGGMPMRPLGRTGTNVSILAFGGGSRFVQYEEDKGIEVLNHALDLGITYIDTADSYGRNGESQVRIGKVLKARGRKGLWLASKIGPRTYDGFMRTLDTSLKRLQVDYVDLLHIHALMGPEDLDAIETKGGAWEAAAKAREQKMARFIGITCHAYPDVLKTALERHDFDCTQMALNAAMRGMVKGAESSFETTALPVALGKKMGVTAMKIFAQDAIVGQAPVDKLIRYSMSLPVAASVIGMPKLAHVEQNIQVAKTFQPLTPEEMKHMSGELAPKNKLALERYFATHVDA